MDSNDPSLCRDGSGYVVGGGKGEDVPVRAIALVVERLNDPDVSVTGVVGDPEQPDDLAENRWRIAGLDLSALDRESRAGEQS